MARCCVSPAHSGRQTASDSASSVPEDTEFQPGCRSAYSYPMAAWKLACSLLRTASRSMRCPNPCTRMNRAMRWRSGCGSSGQSRHHRPQTHHRRHHHGLLHHHRRHHQIHHRRHRVHQGHQNRPGPPGPPPSPPPAIAPISILAISGLPPLLAAAYPRSSAGSRPRRSPCKRIRLSGHAAHNDRVRRRARCIAAAKIAHRGHVDACVPLPCSARIFKACVLVVLDRHRLCSASHSGSSRCRDLFSAPTLPALDLQLPLVLRRSPSRSRPSARRNRSLRSSYSR